MADTTDYRAHPEKYRMGRGEQGVLTIEPYKSELLPHWRFKTPEVARQSADTLFEMFLEYGRQGDFAGMDMARKFIQMGYTRARRYANHKGGRKYDADTGEELPRQTVEDPVKAESAAIFYAVWQQAKADSTYQRLKADYQRRLRAG
ncbi:DUF4385 domain-containing protein [Larsenimonas rhizosphaerae]|uniref:DUF4385 domain-containing protein n=1 Tax=Larsenimonas rhizosphaerae TaxID=2944682 RepID=A0AA41ZF74_9GAMM|nr:DUF4385 domain-containing protein [Larsenimonas rhizosphaerae]MCM2130096.1 DUF4385 domain-containing protein [Larsenimonas rhizosphaerae]MCX2522783.1 DUF4385 domain-containing protein [Larsenimonas rhizosphaerae]